MPQPSYPYACARISALEKGLLSESMIRRMAESSLEDAMRMLLDARYGNMPDATAADCERMIENERKRTAEIIKELSPDPALTDLLLIQADIHNLKVLIKARMLGGNMEVAWQEGGLYQREALEKCVSEQDYRMLPEPISAALNRLERELKVHAEPQIVSILLDYGFHAYCLETASTLKQPEFARDFFDALCDFNNVLTFLRMRAMGAPKEDLKGMLLPACGISEKKLMDAYELSADTLQRALSGSIAKDAMNRGLADMMVSGNIGMVEKARDNYLLSIVKEHKYDAMSIFPVVGYYLARDREGKAVRLILTVKRNGLEDGVITERLRELYG